MVSCLLFDTNAYYLVVWFEGVNVSPFCVLHKLNNVFARKSAFYRALPQLEGGTEDAWKGLVRYFDVQKRDGYSSRSQILCFVKSCIRIVRTSHNHELRDKLVIWVGEHACVFQPNTSRTNIWNLRKILDLGPPKLRRDRSIVPSYRPVLNQVAELTLIFVGDGKINFFFWSRRMTMTKSLNLPVAKWQKPSEFFIGHCIVLGSEQWSGSTFCSMKIHVTEHVACVGGLFSAVAHEGSLWYSVPNVFPFRVWCITPENRCESTNTNVWPNDVHQITRTGDNTWHAHQLYVSILHWHTVVRANIER